MTQFTPGPWGQNPDRPLEVRVGSTGPLICDTTNLAMDHEQRLANARFISAAPGLYDFIARIARISTSDEVAEHDPEDDAMTLQIMIHNARTIVQSLEEVQ